MKKNSIELLNQGKIDTAFIQLYKFYPKTKKVLKKLGANDLEIEDAFQEALLAIYTKVVIKKEEIYTHIEAYLINTCKYILFKKNKVINVSVENIEVVDEVNEWNDNKIQLGLHAFALLQEKCKKILTLFYFEKKSMTEIARYFKYSSETVAKTQKYKCLETAKKNYAQLQLNENR